MSVCYLSYFLTETMSRDGQVQIWGEKFCQFWIRYFDIPERYVQGVIFEIASSAQLKLAQKSSDYLFGQCGLF